MDRWQHTEHLGDLTIETRYNRRMEFHIGQNVQLSSVQPGIRITVLNSRESTVAEETYRSPGRGLFDDVQYSTDGRVVFGTSLNEWLQERIAKLVERGRANRDWDQHPV